MADNALQSAIKRLAGGETLDRAHAAAAFRTVMRGEGTPVQVSALLMALRVKGETPDEVAGAVEALRDAMTPLPLPDPETLVDTCGTGGGAVTTFNISTAAALLAAGAGVRVAKHGNRSFSSKSGSADVLEALGCPIDIPVSAMADVFGEAGIVFMFAPTMHPAMRHVGPVRRELAIGTIMNLVGPLANPARAGRQVIGVADLKRLGLIGGALQHLGTTHSLVVHGAPGMDEISPLGDSTVLEIRGDEGATWTVQPTRYDAMVTEHRELAGADPSENARIIEDVLSGRGMHGAEQAVVLNAAGALYVAGKTPDYASAITRAREALAAGAGREALERLRRASQRAARPA